MKRLFLVSILRRWLGKVIPLYVFSVILGVHFTQDLKDLGKIEETDLGNSKVFSPQSQDK